mgnify:CR=1 FL=1
MFNRTPKPLNERVNKLKTNKEKTFYGISLRDDLARLIIAGMDKQDKNQRELAELSGKKESYISRLLHMAANCNLSIVAQVLIPLGIRPMIVDQAEWNRLQHPKEQTSTASGVTTNVSVPFTNIPTKPAIASTFGSGGSVRNGPQGTTSIGQSAGVLGGSNRVVRADGHQDSYPTFLLVPSSR